VGLKKNNPGCKCCDQAECAPCTSGFAPETFSVTIAGYADDTCASCEDYDGTYVLDYDEGDTTTNACYWYSADETAPCTDSSVATFDLALAIVWIAPSDGSITVSLTNRTSGGTSVWTTVWKNTFGTQPDCADFDEYDVSYDAGESSGSICDASSTTCQVNS